jgi:phosphoesterase RecJ-like protein
MFQKVKEAVERGKRFIVATHVDPDGDALGSAFALGLALAQMGKEAAVYLKGTIPYRYRFLPKPPVILDELPRTGYDIAVVVDCGDLQRVGNDFEALKACGFLINVDHHSTNEAFGQLNIVDERASSTAEILYMILGALGVRISLDIAVNLYTAILTDTGSFRYDCTTQRAFSISEEMVGLGVRPADVATEVYESHPKERFHLLCQVLGTLELYQHDKIATAYVTQRMFEGTGTNREYTEGFVEHIREIRGVEVACLFRELGNGKYKVSMRSKDSVDVAAVARSFGGGGHQRAAGCTLEGDVEAVKNKLLGAFSL